MKPDTYLIAKRVQAQPRAWKKTIRRWKHFHLLAQISNVHLVINRTTLGVATVWPGMTYPYGNVTRMAGELGREQIITDLRAYRAASKCGGDPLALKFNRNCWLHFKTKANALAPSAFIRRITEDFKLPYAAIH